MVSVRHPVWKQENRPLAGTFGIIERSTGSGKSAFSEGESWAWTNDGDPHGRVRLPVARRRRMFLRRRNF